MAEGPAPDGSRWVSSTQPRPGHRRLSRMQAFASAPALQVFPRNQFCSVANLYTQVVQGIMFP